MESSRTCSTCASSDDEDNYSQSEQTETCNTFCKPVQSYSNVLIPQMYPYYSPQQYLHQQQSYKDPYKPHGYDNFAYGSRAYIPTYSSQVSTVGYQQQLPLHNRPDMYPLRYVMPPVQMPMHSVYYTVPKVENQRHLVQYFEQSSNQPYSKEVQHQMCQTSSTATSMFNIDSKLNYGYDPQNSSEVASYKQQQPIQTSNLRFINMQSLGASANIPDDKDSEDQTDSNTDYNNSDKNEKFTKPNVVGGKSLKKPPLTLGWIGIIGMAIFMAALILATVLGVVLTKS
jgi:hypothetical protein